MRGSCLCGTVRYKYHGPTADISLCHCHQCQKAQGSAFVAIMPVATADFVWIQGRDAVREFNSSGDKYRAFCSLCGSPLYSRRDAKPEVYRLRLGTLDEPLLQTARHHKFYAERVSWYQTRDDLPKLPGQE